MDGATARLATVRAVATGASSLFTGLCAVVVLWVGIDAVRHGSVPDVLLATLPLAAIATFEAIGPLAAAVQRLDATEAAGAGCSRSSTRDPRSWTRPRPRHHQRCSDSRSTASGSGTRAGRATSSTASRY